MGKYFYNGVLRLAKYESHSNKSNCRPRLKCSKQCSRNECGQENDHQPHADLVSPRTLVAFPCHDCGGQHDIVQISLIWVMSP